MKRGSLLVGFLLVVVAVHAGTVSKPRDPNDKTHGFGTTIKWVTDLDMGLAQARAFKKPVFLLIFNHMCGACEMLKTRVKNAPKEGKMVTLSKKFIMVNTQKLSTRIVIEGEGAQEAPEVDRYSPEGEEYIPRVYILEPKTGKMVRSLHKRKGNQEYKYFFSKVEEIEVLMEEALEYFANAKADSQAQVHAPHDEL